MTSEAPESFSAVQGGPPVESLRAEYERRQVKAVIDSYHGRLDAFAEGCQNAVDAIQRRWRNWQPPEDLEDTEIDAVPRVRIILNADENAMEIVDNGTGISAAELPSLLAPFVSDKGKPGDGERGHKGVGTTFLAFGHPWFEIHTRAAGTSPIGYRIEGGRSWVMSSDDRQAPSYRRLSATHPSLNALASGTFIKVGFDNTTSLKHVGKVLHDTPRMWAQVLRSTTAIGNVELEVARRDMPAWARYLKAMVEHRDGTDQASFSFPLPDTGLGPTEARELQWLQNNPSSRREYELIFIRRGHMALRSLLHAELTALENEDTEDARAIVAAFDRYQASAYAALAYKNTYYEEQFRSLIERPSATNLSLSPGVGGGVMVSSVGMPMVSLQNHLAEKMQPQERRRYFLLVELNQAFSPDIGRKTIPEAVVPLVAWLEQALLRLLRTQATRLLRDRESSTRPTGMSLTTSAEEIRTLAKRVEGLERMDDELDFHDLPLQRSPAWEDEVVVLFVAMLSRGQLPGYRLRAVPGALGRYDALFDYRLTPSEQSNVPTTLRVSDYHLSDEGITLTDQWLEFKRDINGFIENLEADDGTSSKKYFSQVAVLVVWSVSAITSDTYSVEEFDDLTRKDRVFLASTHRIVAEGNEHVVHVIELRRVIEALNVDA